MFFKDGYLLLEEIFSLKNFSSPSILEGEKEYSCAFQVLDYFLDDIYEKFQIIFKIDNLEQKGLIKVLNFIHNLDQNEEILKQGDYKSKYEKVNCKINKIKFHKKAFSFFLDIKFLFNLE